MIALVFGVVMAVVHYFSESLAQGFKQERADLMSFSAGVSISYLFLHLLPDFSRGVTEYNEYIFLSILAGFVSIHLTEKYIYKHATKDKRRRELALEDSIVSFMYHLMVGIIITVSLAESTLYETVLFFAPILLYTGVSTLPVDAPKSKLARAALSVSTLIGIIIGMVFMTGISQTMYLALLGVVIGILTYTTIRHGIPSGTQGTPIFFFLGVLMYSAIIMMGWS
jgi:hypothetical protein